MSHLKLSKRGALAIMRQRFGERAFVRDNGRALTKEKRTAAQAALAAHREQRPATIEPRLFAELPEDERRQHNAEYRAWRQEESRLMGEALSFRFDVGHSSGYFNTIDGQGDTWEEAIASYQRKWIS